MAALTSEADYVFVPESPPPEDWQKRLCDKLEQVRFSIEIKWNVFCTNHLICNLIISACLTNRPLIV